MATLVRQADLKLSVPALKVGESSVGSVTEASQECSDHQPALRTVKKKKKDQRYVLVPQSIVRHSH